MPSNEVRLHSSISEVKEACWDAILSAEHVFHTHRFIKAVELAKIEESRSWPLCFYEDNELVATAVLSAFRVDLGIFVEEPIKEKIQSLRKLFPRFLKPKILFCGLPVSLGQSNLVISSPESSDWVLGALDKTMRSLAKRYRVRFLALKEFDEQRCLRFGTLESLGYSKVNSIPYMSLAIKWSTYEEYLQALKHSYRRQIKLSLKKIDSLSILDNTDQLASEGTVIRLNNWEKCSPVLFFSYYLKVMNRADTKLETLNLKFFEQCFAKLREDIILITVERKEEILSAALLFKHDPYLTFALVGNNSYKDADSDPYFNLIHAITRYAIDNGFEQLKLGQTAYWVKQRIGGEPAARYLYFKVNGKLLLKAMKPFYPLIFPKTQLVKNHAFKQKE